MEQDTIPKKVFAGKVASLGLLHFSTSLSLLTDEISSIHQESVIPFSCTASEQENLVTYFLQTYQDMLQSVSGNKDETKRKIDEPFLKSGFIQDKLRDRQGKVHADLLKKLTSKKNSIRHFDRTKRVGFAPISDVEELQIINKRHISPQLLYGRSSKRPLIGCLKAIIAR